MLSFLDFICKYALNEYLIVDKLGGEIVPDAVPDVVLAVVRNVCEEGGKRYAVTNPLKSVPPLSTDTSITFSLADWRGDQDPRKQQVVKLANVSRFRRGWRALVAEPSRE